MPLASCIMPTSGRRAFLPQAIRLFQAQDWPSKELIVLDNGAQPVADLLPDDPAIRYVREQPGQPLGQLRNRACAEARGEFLLHWDDDDWYAPWRIRYQVDALRNSDADICGIDRVYFMDEERRRAWQYVYPADRDRWVCGATLCFRRDYWQANPFRPIHVGEDSRFVQDAGAARIAVLPETGFFIGRVHADNTSPKQTRAPLWHPKPFEQVQALKQTAAPNPGPAPSSQAGGAMLVAGGGIGDILRTTPLIRVLHQLGHEVDVLLLADYPGVADLLRGAPEIRDLWVSSPGKAARAVPRREYGVVLYNSFGAPGLTGIRGTVSTLRFDPARWNRHGDSACVAELAQSLGWHGPLPLPFARPSERRFDLPTGTIALHPGCKPGWPWKRWHGFDQLAARFPHVAVVGTAEDLETGGTYFRQPFQWPAHARIFAGALDLPDTAALLSQCAALVSNDSGLMHLGAALGIPTFGIFGITSPAREAMPVPSMTSITKGLPCEAACRRRSWGRKDCSHHLECLKSLTADAVATRVTTALSHPQPPAPVRNEESMPPISVNYYGYMFDASGYGQAARTYVHALHRAGIRLSVVDLGVKPAQVDDPLVRSLLGRDPQADFQLFHGIPPQWAQRAFPFRPQDVIAMTVWETDTMPQTWRPALSHAGDVWLPCRFNVEVFGRALKAEPFLLPHARTPTVDPAALPIAEIGPEDWVCYSVFEWQERKDPDAMLEAFLTAFPETDDAVLVLKTSGAAAKAAARSLEQARKKTGSEGRVILCCTGWSDAELAALHERGDCYLSLHRGEGWGYPLFEAACRGKPVVAPHYSGPADFLDSEAHPPVRHHPAAVTQPYTYYTRRMKWARADVAHAAEVLRQIHDNRDAAAAKARTAAEQINLRFSLDAIGQRAKARLTELLARKGGAPELTALLTADPILKADGTEPVGKTAAPIPGAWYDANYFEHGRTSNWSQGYHWKLFAGVFQDTAAYLTELLPDTVTVLDAGCAKGFLVRTLRQAGRQAWGFDHSPWAIDRADPMAQPHLSLAGVDDVVFDRSYDLITAMSLLEKLTEDQCRTFLSRAAGRGKTLFAVIAIPPDGEDTTALDGDRDQSRVTLRPAHWWEDLFAGCGWVPHPAQTAARAHPLPRRMGWQVFLRASGSAQP
ncbi:glycosyltransferase [Novispirillum itersonii]|uniref:ADP-heptose:LPS heptosyltransferase n=1 Tax=Novispirillum itersonii TaxID=189 RepID=A0A7W9ZL73_NOVIT|nr:glycosyltransferase [Novispirillum itersonii]MBB6212274.1 ADP-heptose:LPS heptosyltransferase [Novispirillum itersonii]